MCTKGVDSRLALQTLENFGQERQGEGAWKAYYVIAQFALSCCFVVENMNLAATFLFGFGLLGKRFPHFVPGRFLSSNLGRNCDTQDTCLVMRALQRKPHLVTDERLYDG